MADAVETVTIIVYDDETEVSRCVVPREYGKSVAKTIEVVYGFQVEIIPN